MEEVLDHKKTYEDLVVSRSVNYNYIQKANELVLAFIVKRNLVIYGGMAIDRNLKRAGHEGIYPPSTVPDYDFFSPNFFQDSLDLADILHKAGLPNISAINQVHPSGRRVRVNGETVADISYVPPEVYAKIPVIDDHGLKIVAPEYQRLDMHRAFCYPYENVPRETIMHRFNKDQKRFKLLNEHFPVKLVKQTGPKSQKITLSYDLLRDHLVTGVLQYGILRRWLEVLIRDNTNLMDLFRKTEEVPVSFKPEGVVIEWQSLARPRLSLITLNLDKSLAKVNPGPLHEVRYYQRFMDDLRPRAARLYYYDTGVEEAKSWMAIERSESAKAQITEVAKQLLADYKSWMDQEPKLAPKIFELTDANPETLLKIWDEVTGSHPRSEQLVKQLRSLQADLSKEVMPKPVPELELLDLEMGLIPAYQMTEIMNVLKREAKPPSEWSKISWKGIQVPHAQYLAMNLLVSSFERPKHAAWFRSLYASTLLLIQIAEMTKVISPDVPNPFLLTAETVGTRNLNWAQISMARDRWMSIQGYKIDDVGLVLRPPFGYYPDKGKAHPVFDPSKSPIFEFAGVRTGKFEPLQILLPMMRMNLTEPVEKESEN